jgi:hypothetical protein
VRGRVLQKLHLIPGPGNDTSAALDHGADGNFFRFKCLHRQTQRFTHEIVIALQVDNGRIHG